MKLKKFFKSLKECKPMRDEYYIEKKFVFEIDDSHYGFYILPTILFVPWICRYTGSCCIEIMWLNLHLCWGIWRRKDGRWHDGQRL